MKDPAVPGSPGLDMQTTACERREFARSMDCLEAVFAFVRPILDARGVGAADAYAVKMTIEELFTNMVKYNASGSGHIGIEIECHVDSLVCRLTDPDSGYFDPTRAPDVDIHQPVEQRRPGGLGIHLIRRLVDTLDYDYAERRSRITFRRTLTGADAPLFPAGGSGEPGLI